jgi:hypothetical protein
MGKYYVTTKRAKDTKGWEIITFQFLTSCSSRLRGDNICFDFGYGSAALGPPWSNLWLSAEPLLGPIRYPRSSILDPRSLWFAAPPRDVEVIY